MTCSRLACPAALALAAALLRGGGAPAEEPFRLWDPGRPVPKSAQAAHVRGAEFHVIQPRRPEKDGYNWLHGVAVARHEGVLYATFGHNRGKENTATEVANARASRDGGRTWGPRFAVDDGGEDLAVSHGVLLSHEGRLWGFHGCFTGRMQDVHTRAYVLDEKGGRWQARGVVARQGFWPMQGPQKLEGGGWIMAGVSVTGGYGGPDDPAAVALSRGEDLTRWDVVPVPKPEDMVMWGESSVIVHRGGLLLVARYGKPVALASTSDDGGRTWTPVRETNLPMAASKPCVGELSTGQRYLIGTTTADSGNRRRPLTIAVTRPGELVFRTIYRIRDAVFAGPGESAPDAALSYPYAAEYDGRLHVVYSNDGGRGANRNSAELAILPVAGLKAE